MPLDPVVAEMLENNRRSGAAFDPRALPPAEIVARLRATIPQAKPFPPSVEIGNREIPGPNGPVPLRVYRPASDGLLGACISLHGGGWVLGDLEYDHRRAHDLAAAAGAVIVSVDYRLAPEHRFPAPLEDSYAAAKWVVAHAEELGVSPDLVAISGASAGGNLAAAVALLARDRGEFKLVLQLLIYPVLDGTLSLPSVAENSTYSMSGDLLAWFWEQYTSNAGERTSAYASPFHASDLRGLAPAHILTGEYDPLRDEGEAYAARLETAGVPVRTTRYSGMTHGFVATMPDHPASVRAKKECAEALREAFGQQRRQRR